MRRALVALSVLAVWAACTPASKGTSSAPPDPPVPPAASHARAPDAGDLAAAPDAGADAGAGAEEREEAIGDPSYDQILGVLGITAAECGSMVGEAKIRCALEERYRPDPKSASLAYELWTKWRIVAGVERAHTMDGGYRGLIRLEPAVPVNGERKHIEWVTGAMRDLDRFWTELDAFAKPRAGSGAPKRYRWRPITLRFMRSMNGKRTPSAYAHDWTVAWNLEGSLHRSEDAVRETLVHEIFHLNDAAHAATADGWWSQPALGKDFDAIVKKCGTSIPCLGPYTPNETKVKGGTYYAFQPGNGVVEYAAELALRYYREQRAVLRKLPKVKPFKCGPPENARSWEKMRDEFFGGVDAVPPCGQ